MSNLVHTPPTPLQYYDGAERKHDLLVKGHNRFGIAEILKVYHSTLLYSKILLISDSKQEKGGELNDVSSCLLSIEHKDLINHIELLLENRSISLLILALLKSLLHYVQQ